MMCKNFDTGELWTRDEIEEIYNAEESLSEEYGTFDEYLEHLLDLGRQKAGGVIWVETANTYGYGALELADDTEEYKLSRGYNDGEINGVTYAVGDYEQTGKMIEVREREDGTLFAVLVD